MTAPAAGIRYCLEKVVEFAEQQMTDDEPVREELMALALELEEGRIGEAEHAEREKALLARLREIRERQLGEQAAGLEKVASGEMKVTGVEATAYDSNE